MAGIIALLSGAYLVAAIILATSVTVTTLWVVLFFASSKHTFQLPKGLARAAATTTAEVSAAATSSSAPAGTASGAGAGEAKGKYRIKKKRG